MSSTIAFVRGGYSWKNRDSFSAALRKRYAITNPQGSLLCFPTKNSHKSLDLRLFFAERQGFFLRCAAKALRDNEPSGFSPVLSYKKQPQVFGLAAVFAERQGFEPWVPVRVQRFSRPSRSTTPASFLIGRQLSTLLSNIHEIVFSVRRSRQDVYLKSATKLLFFLMPTKCYSLIICRKCKISWTWQCFGGIRHL